MLPVGRKSVDIVNKLSLMIAHDEYSIKGDEKEI